MEELQGGMMTWSGCAFAAKWRLYNIKEVI
jgi:hypothetical protein